MTDPLASVEPLHRPGKKASGPALSPRAAEFLGKATVAADFKPHLDRPYVVKNWLTPAAMSVVYGDSNVGKTFFALDLGYHVAGGRAWNGCKVRGGAVLYVAAEGGHGFGNRIAALEARDGVPLWTLPTAIDICKADADTKALIELIAHLARHHGGYALIVIDTLARAMGSGDENASPDMGAFVRNLDHLRAKTGAHHHRGFPAFRFQSLTDLIGLGFRLGVIFRCEFKHADADRSQFAQGIGKFRIFILNSCTKKPNQYGGQGNLDLRFVAGY